MHKTSSNRDKRKNMPESPNILIFGDICPDNNYRVLFDKEPQGPFASEIVADIKNSAFVIGNLECPVTNNKTPSVKCGPNLRSEPRNLQLIKELGFGALSLANNHILDYGAQGVCDTLHYCEENNIAFWGGGLNATQASLPLIRQIAGYKVGLLSFAEAEFNLASKSTPGANHFDPYSSFDDVEQLKKQCDFVVVLYHGGIEHCKIPSPLLRKKCQKFARSGADLVLCQHSHCIGTMEKLASATILYGQGNSVFGYRNGDLAWNEGLVVNVDLLTHEISFKLMNATLSGIVYADAISSKCRLEMMRRDSLILQDDSRYYQEWSDFCSKQSSLYLPMLYGWNRIMNKMNRLLKNRLINMLISRHKQRVTMNLLRCEAHHEVLQTILEKRGLL